MLSSLLLPVALLAACRNPIETPDTQAGSHVDLGDSTPRNAVVIHVDTLRADSLPLWGGARDTMPNLTRRGGWVSVERTVSTSSWTAPATASLLTGTPPHVHDVRFYDSTGPNYAMAVPSFASHLQEQGVTTALFTGNSVVLSAHWEIDRGFASSHQNLAEPSNAAALVEDAAGWLDARDPEVPFLLFLQPMDMHSPYRPEEQDRWTWALPENEFFDNEAPLDVQFQQIKDAIDTSGPERDLLLETLRAIYDEQTLGLDRALATLMDDLEARGLLDETLVVITADHGETFFDGYLYHLSHGNFPRHEVVSVPLLFWANGQPEGQVSCLASNMDVFPTVLQAMGLSPMEGVEGVSLLEGCRETAFSVLSKAAGAVETLHFVSVESLDAQLVVDCRVSEEVAFDLVADPLALTPKTRATVPGGEALGEALRGYTTEVLAAMPSVTCPGAL